MRSLLTSPVAKGFYGAVAGMILVLLLVHAYFDHKALHDIVNIINTNAAKAAAPLPK